MSYDFEGWATKNDLKCADGLTIREGAFKVNNGTRVPLVYNHEHNDIGSVLGHADLENRRGGVWAKARFNNTAAGIAAKETVRHGDVVSLSIWANNVQQVGSDVIHGVIREVSLVLAGANPGAFVESVLEHGMPMNDGEEEGIFYTGDGIIISHANSDKPDPDPEPKKKKQDDGDGGPGETVGDVIKTMNDDQKRAMAIMIGQAIRDTKKEMGSGDGDDNDNNGGGDSVKHNIFEGTYRSGSVISHSDMKTILKDAKSMGSLREAVEYHTSEGILSHGIDTTGMDVPTGTQDYGFRDPSMLFPDYKSLNNSPEWISRNMDWVTKFMGKVHHTPFSRIKSVYANITEDEARAKGYMKGKLKKEEVFSLLKRTTDPQTIFKKQKMDRDDVIDIIDFDVIAWIKAEMRVMLDEEIARACLIGDGRFSDSDDKIKEEHIRPIVKDKPLFNTVVKVTVSTAATPEEIAKETIKAAIRARKNYKGSGKPDFWTTEDTITEMLLIENQIGDAIYKTEGELATKMRVAELIPVEVMEGHEIEVDGKKYPMIGVVCNAADYNIGADKGGAVNLFDDFDLDYNQMIYLIETRISGALVKPFSAITLVLDKKMG